MSDTLQQHLNNAILPNIICVVTRDMNKHGSAVYNLKNDTLTFYGSSENKCLMRAQKLWPSLISILIPCKSSQIALDNHGNIRGIITIKNQRNFKNETDNLLDRIASIERVIVFMKNEFPLPIKYRMLLLKNGIHSMSKFASLTETDLDKMGIKSPRRKNSILRCVEDINVVNDDKSICDTINDSDDSN